MSLLRAPTEIFCPLLVPLSPCPGIAQITVDPETPHKKILILLQHVLPPCQRGTGSSGRLMELCTLDTLTRAASPLLQTADLLMSLLRAPTEIFCPLLCSTVSVSLITLDHGRSGDTPQENTDSSATRLGPHANEGPSSCRLMELCTLTPSRCGFTSSADSRRSSARFSFHCLRVLGIASDHGRSGDTPQENTDSSATRLASCQRGTGSSGCLMELCTLTPHACGFTFLFCRQPKIFCLASFHCLRVLGIASDHASLDEPPGPPDLPASRSTVSVTWDVSDHASGWMSLLRAPTEIFSARFSFHCLRVLGIASDHGRSGDTPQENTDSLQHVPGPHANPGTVGSSGRLMELCTLTPSRVRLHLLLQTADFRFRMSLLRAPTEIFCSASFHCLRVLGIAQITCKPLRPELGSGYRALGLCPKGPPAACSSYHALGLYPLSLVLGRSGDTPQENTDSSANTFCPHANEGTGSSRLMELCTLDTLTRAASPSADSRGPPAVCSSYHALGLYPLSLVLGRSGDTPQENTDSSATFFGPHANEGTGSRPLRELCTLDTLTRAASPLLQTAEATSSLFQLGFHALGLYPLIGPRVDPETPHKKILILLATRLSPHANEGPEQWPLDGTLHLTPSRVRLHLSADSRSVLLLTLPSFLPLLPPVASESFANGAEFLPSNISWSHDSRSVV
ncbi:hypothetical protein MUG91_G3781n1, partial [Manis pentadactyla]